MLVGVQFPPGPTNYKEDTVHQEIKSIMKYFEFDHLPPHLQEVSKPMHALAHQMAKNLPENEELMVGLRKLLEAKDCFVRAKLG